MKKSHLAFLLILPTLLLLGSCSWQQKPAPDGGGILFPDTKVVPDGKTDSTRSRTHTIEITENGFSPALLTVRKGDVVRFVNRDTTPHWPASASHPSHRVYPGSDIAKCGTAEQGNIFDACKGLAKDEIFSFTFTETGEWGYHDHMAPRMFGKITVQNSGASDVPKGGAVNTGTVMYFPGMKYAGYLAKPSAPGKHPGLILIHEWWGLNDNIRKLAQDFAKEWYVVLAVDLYGKPATTQSGVAMQMASEVSKNEALAFENLGYAVEFLRSSPDVDPARLWSVGWCFGGGWAYQMAKNNLGTRASVMYYGRFNPKDDLQMMRSQILGHFGEKDMSISIDSVNEFQAKLRSLSGSTSAIYIYPNAGHGFANESGAAYDKAAADTAWQRTVDFLAKNVKTR